MAFVAAHGSAEKSELKQNHICRPIGGRWEPDAGGETQPACQLEWPQEANSPDGDSILGELDRPRQRGPHASLHLHRSFSR